MRVHREGTSTLLISSALLCFALFALWHWDPLPYLLQLALSAVLLVVYAIVVLFFRVPQRLVKLASNTVVAPADGKVVVIEEVEETEYFKGKRLQVSIFMSPLNVHVNWYPISGTTSYFKYHPGKYLVAWHPKSSVENERSSVVIDHPIYGEVLMRQIAGAMARRICTYATPGSPAEQGAEMGFIKFGSRVDVFLPIGTSIGVSLGQKVIGAHTVIAEFK